MAYGNWGATVYCDGKPMHKNCDATPNQVLDNKEGYQFFLQHYIQKDLKENLFDNMYHAVVGDKGAGVLVFLYKSWPSEIIKLLGNDKYEIIRTKMDEKDFEWYESDGFKIDVHGIKIKLEPTESPEGVTCEFKDKKGRIWKAKSAYCYGEGHHGWE